MLDVLDVPSRPRAKKNHVRFIEYCVSCGSCVGSSTKFWRRYFCRTAGRLLAVSNIALKSKEQIPCAPSVAPDRRGKPTSSPNILQLGGLNLIWTVCFCFLVADRVWRRRCREDTRKGENRMLLDEGGSDRQAVNVDSSTAILTAIVGFSARGTCSLGDGYWFILFFLVLIAPSTGRHIFSFANIRRHHDVRSARKHKTISALFVVEISYRNSLNANAALCMTWFFHTRHKTHYGP